MFAPINANVGVVIRRLKAETIDADSHVRIGRRLSATQSTQKENGS
jgi:hypothetical protein